MDFKLPNLGDGIDSAAILSILVSVGDSVQKDDTIMELETDKAVAPISAPVSGKIEKILVAEGDKVSEGTHVVTFSGAGASSEAAPAAQPAAQAQAPTQQVAAAPAVLPQGGGQYVMQQGEPAPTSPTIRHAAKQFGIDLMRIPGTGRGGRITTEDVKKYMLHIQSVSFAPKPEAASTSAAVAGPKPLDIDFSKWGKVKIEKASGLRKKVSENLTHAWNTIPHVTQFDDVDITALMELRKKYNPKFMKKNARITVTTFALKAIVDSLKAFPNFNASYDAATNEMIYKEYYHIGIAVDTPAGLVVPVIRDVDKKSVFELSLELEALAEKARDRKLSLDDMRGATFTISNLGSLGVSSFTPIVNHPEVAILGMSKGSFQAEYDKTGEMSLKMKMPLSLSYDHRVIDGADGARFTRHFIETLESFDEKLLKI